MKFKDTYNIVDLQYFADINSFKKIVAITNASFFEDEVYNKLAFLNRCRIAGANGPILLSVPLEKGRNQRTIFKEVRISNEEKWQLRHWRSILSSYNASPWFGYYKDEMAGLYMKRFDFLIDWNQACMKWILEKFALSLSIHSISTTSNLCQQTMADLRPRPGNNPIEVGHPIRYPQVYEDKIGFIPGLSVIDLLFCVGPKRAINLLGQSPD